MTANEGGRGPRVLSGGWMVAELDRLATDRPGLVRLIRQGWTNPTVVLMTLAVVVGALAGLGRQDGDQVRFREAGAAMVGPGFLDVFSDSWLQIGPLYLLALGVVARLGAVLHLPLPLMSATAAALHAVVIVWLATMCARKAAETTGAPVLRAQWAIGGGLLLGGFVNNALLADHPEEVLLGLLLALAAVFADQGRLWLSALLFVVGGGIKQWAPTGAGALLKGRNLRRTAFAVGVLVAGLALCYLPFRLWGDMQTFTMEWPHPRRTWFEQVPVLAGMSDWSHRLIQGALAGLAGALVAWRRHGSTLVAVMAAVCVRLLLDPLRLTYYWTALAAILLVWLWTTNETALRRSRLAITLVIPIITFGRLLPEGAAWHLETVAAIVLPVYALLVEWSGASRRSSRAVLEFADEREPAPVV